jgi:hypothetical protein
MSKIEKKKRDIMRISFSTFISVNAMRFNLIFESTKGAHVFVWYFKFLQQFFYPWLHHVICEKL